MIVYISLHGLISTAGIHLGNVISFPLSGVLCQYGFDGGWPSVFYVCGEYFNTSEDAKQSEGDQFCSLKLCWLSSFTGTAGILWFFAWIFLAYSSPATHPRISREEREYIEFSIAESTEKQVHSTECVSYTVPFLYVDLPM